MAGSAVFSYKLLDSGEVVKLTWVCTADAAGAVSSPTITQGGSGLFNYYTPFSGIIGQHRIKPGAGGDQPDALYDVKLNPVDDTTLDFLGGAGLNCSQTDTVLDVPATTVNGAGISLFEDIIQPYAANCGAGNKFTLTVHLWLKGRVD